VQRKRTINSLMNSNTQATITKLFCHIPFLENTKVSSRSAAVKKIIFLRKFGKMHQLIISHVPRVMLVDSTTDQSVVPEPKGPEKVEFLSSCCHSNSSKIFRCSQICCIHCITRVIDNHAVTSYCRSCFHK
jgi:hypothetical protein